MSSQYTAQQILSFSSFNQLFSKDGSEKELRTLRHQWHPDRCKDKLATDVFTHISALYEMGFVPPEVEYINKDGKSAVYLFEAKYKTSFGMAYVRNGSVAYVFEDDYLFLIDLFKQNFKEYSDNLQKSKHLKNYEYSLFRVYPINSPQNILILQLPKDFVPVIYLMNHFNGAIEPRITAWILSRCFDIGMLYHSMDKVANGFDLELLYVDLEGHRVLDLNPMFYSVGHNAKLKALSSNTVSMYPADCLYNKTAESKCDVALIKALGVRLLGDATYTGALLGSSIPSALKQWLTSPTLKGKLESYSEWQQKVLINAFGARKFYKYVVPVAQLLKGK